MHKIYIPLLASFLLSITISKASNVVDSIGVENYKGKKLILHKVEAKETYYSLAKRYNVKYKDIMSFNDNKSLQIGIVLKIPTEIVFASNAAPTTSTNNGSTIAYTIKAKDNLNMLAEKYGTTVDEIKRINGLKTNNLQIGQVINIASNGNLPTSGNDDQTNTQAAPTKADIQNVDVENVAKAEHTIKAKENLNLLAEKYGTTVNEIKRLNGLTSNNLRIGQVLKIPNTNNLAESTPTTAIAKTNQTPVLTQPVLTNSGIMPYEHMVAAGETIYSIAKKYGLTTYQIKTANNLTSNELTVGQKLIVKDAKTYTENTNENDTATSNINTIKDPALRYPASKYGIKQIEEKGTAVWIADQDLDPNKMLVLHRTAPVGTIIKVTNPMSNRSTFAKVVGKFTENETTKDVIIVMTKAVADAVGALDKRFYCNINYGAQENEQ